MKTSLRNLFALPFLMTFCLPGHLPAQQAQAPAQVQSPQPAPPPSPATTPSTKTQVAPATPPPQPEGLYGPWSVTAYYWLTSANAKLLGGQAATDYEDLTYPGSAKRSPDVEVEVPISKTGMLNINAFITKGDGNSIATRNLDLFSTGYVPGDFLSSQYLVEGVKIDLQDLFYPFPRKEGQKYRIKTLWGIQYANMETTIDAPLKAVAVDSSGNPISNTATGSRWVIYPSLGMAAEYRLSHNVLVKADASGFGIPHHSTVWDAEGTIGYRHGSWEIVAGEKAFYFKTSSENAQYFKTLLYGAFAGVRWYPGKLF